jgi:sec-independent protein translocase protein TatA
MGFGPSPMEIAVIAVIALIVLGPQKLPEAARSLGKGFREMRDSFAGVADGSNERLDEYPEDEEEFGDEDGEEDEEEEEYEPELVPLDESSGDEQASAPDHQKDAESSVPSASSSSTERE